MKLNNADDVIKTAEISTADDLNSIRLIANFESIIIF